MCLILTRDSMGIIRLSKMVWFLIFQKSQTEMSEGIMRIVNWSYYLWAHEPSRQQWQTLLFVHIKDTTHVIWQWIKWFTAVISDMEDGRGFRGITFWKQKYFHWKLYKTVTVQFFISTSLGSNWSPAKPK
jgi:hypothetical protein